MRFVDFAIRAWREGPYVQVMAHATPAGGMRQPVAVRLGPVSADDLRLPDDASLAEGARIGRELARVLLGDAVWRLLGESLRAIAPDPTLGLRLRLCLDEELIDLPWELLYRPDVEAPCACSGFLLMDGRISLVREPPSVLAAARVSDRAHRGLFVGAYFDDGRDTWKVRAEHRSLARALRPVGDLLTLDFARGDAGDAIDRALAEGCDLFHYAGHTERDDAGGTLVQRARDAGARLLDALPTRAAWAATPTLGGLLARAGTRLAVFNACNSGYWPFVRPLMRAGIPAVVGVQGIVSNVAALHFARCLYESLAVGLSLDEALTFARLHVVQRARGAGPCDWARFMTYMPTDDAVLFPRPARATIETRKQAVRVARDRAVRGVAERARRLDGAGMSRMLSELAQRSVLILGRFTDERKTVLDAIRRRLETPPNAYLPVLFDFEQPRDRNLVESILRFAAVSRFVIADLSDPNSVQVELQAIVPQFPSLPVIPIIEGSQREYPMFESIRERQSVRRLLRYRDRAHLLAVLDAEVLQPAEALYARLNPAAAP